MPGRYQFSLPERRSRDGWFKVGSLDITTTALLVILGISSMFVYAASSVFLYKFAFIGPFVRDGDVWRLITWPLVNPPTDIWVILTFVFFWFVGHRIEDQLGRRRFTVLVVLMTLLPAAFVTLLEFTANTSVAFGLGILGTGLLVVFAFDNPGAMFFFNIPVWILALVFVGIDVLRLTGDRLYGQLLLELGVIVVALVTCRQYGMLEHFTFIPRFGGGGQRRPVRSVRPARAPRRGGGAPAPVVTGPWGRSAQSAADQIELDELLDKIGATGMDSLTRGEKQRLNELSKRLRGH